MQSVNFSGGIKRLGKRPKEDTLFVNTENPFDKPPTIKKNVLRSF